MADSVIFPDEIPNGTPAWNDRILFSKTSAGWETQDAEISKLPIPDSVVTALNWKENLSNKSTNTNLGNSDTLYPSQNAVKTYVDAQVATATIPDATTSIKWKVKLAWDLAGTADNPTVPALWNKVDKTTTVNWKALSSNVTLNTDDIWEWANNKYDKTVILTPWNDINITWSYPNFTIENTAKGHIIQDEWVDVNNRWKLNFKDWFVVTDNAWNNSTDIWLEFERIPEYDITNVLEDRQLDWNNTTLNEIANVVGTLVKDVENVAFIAWDWMQKAMYDPSNKSKEVAFDDEVIKLDEKWANNWVAELDWSWKVPTSQLPAIAITETFVVNSQSAQLALSAQEWDVCIRTDQNKSYIQNWWSAWTMADWQELLTPTDAVTSVAWKVWVVTLVKWDVGLWNVDNTSDVNKPVSTAQQTALNWKANLLWDNTFNWWINTFVWDSAIIFKEGWPWQYTWFQFINSNWTFAWEMKKADGGDIYIKSWGYLFLFKANWLLETQWFLRANWLTVKSSWVNRYDFYQYDNWPNARRIVLAAYDQSWNWIWNPIEIDNHSNAEWNRYVKFSERTVIREERVNDEMSFWTWSQAEYNAIWTKNNKTLYIIKDA